MSVLRDAFRELAEDAPEVRPPAGLYAAARRRRRERRAAAALLALAVLAVAVLIGWPRPGPERFGGDSAGLPDHLVLPSWDTATVHDSPAGPAAVAYSLGERNVQSDDEDFRIFSWWRHGHTVSSTTVVGLHEDVYRIARGGYTTGVDLSPDGRFLMVGGEALDLSTGRTRALPKLTGPRPQAGPSSTPYYGYGGVTTWSPEGTRVVVVDQSRVAVAGWPSGRIEWNATFPYQNYIGDAVIPEDGSAVALTLDDEIVVLNRDGTRRWSRSKHEPWLVSGRAAWRPDGRLVGLTREVNGPYRLAALDGATGAPVDIGAYPPVSAAMGMEVVAWRGDVAYAIVRHAVPGIYTQDEIPFPELVRLVPGAAAPEVVLKPPAGTEQLAVATVFVDARRATGAPEFGVNFYEYLGRGLNWACCPVVLIGFLVMVRKTVRWSTQV
ncbi:hypothetical protein Val02_46180 [Virgisporangium aliadipatigenens]|uniref:Uncharacterized protein n=1 Tax=Virgisporangium aliadipatigenens TaxID=741659 RepID=A0A8J3YNL8_9ACTN|nr:hypothetical protein [Virgisporangium aliadipatigenens]GIJ47732.1 hypothetical protein Val02_46180 [Virgisporangium aliadipatigenens]